MNGCKMETERRIESLPHRWIGNNGQSGRQTYTPVKLERHNSVAHLCAETTVITSYKLTCLILTPPLINRLAEC